MFAKKRVMRRLKISLFFELKDIIVCGVWGILENFMKNILIIGAARSGKTTLAKMVHDKFGHSIVSVDAFISAFQERYPNIGFAHHGKNNHLICPFMVSYTEALIYNYPEMHFVIEGYHIKPEDAVKYFLNKNFEIVVLGYPQLTVKEAYNNVRKYEQKFDYTTSIKKEEMCSILEHHIAYSKDCAQKCVELNLSFYDTSFNRDEVLNSIMKRIS